MELKTDLQPEHGVARTLTHIENCFFILLTTQSVRLRLPTEMFINLSEISTNSTCHVKARPYRSAAGSGGRYTCLINAPKIQPKFSYFSYFHFDHSAFGLDSCQRNTHAIKIQIQVIINKVLNAVQSILIKTEKICAHRRTETNYAKAIERRLS